MKNLIWIMVIIGLIGCSAASVKKSEFEQTGQELKDILKKDKNLTEAQKIVIKHAITNLKDASKTNKENADLQKKVISTAKDAGAGRMIYIILGVVGLGIIAFVVAKVMKVFP